MHWIALLAAPDAELTDPLAAWGWAALQFTPRVARLEDVLLMEVSASERLFGGEAQLLQALLQSIAPRQNLAPECALGPTALVAFGRLKAGLADALPAQLPLSVLPAARPHLPTLLRLGCRNWGELRGLPRGGLARRFGAELVEALDQAFGVRAESFQWIGLPEHFTARLELAAAVESAPAMLFGARRLLEQLRIWLRARQHGVLALELLWELDARRSNALHVDAHHRGDSIGRLLLRSAQPSQDMEHLQRILAERLAQVELPAPVLYLQMRSLQSQPMAGTSLSLLPEDLRRGYSQQQMLERLLARFGTGRIWRVIAHADHRPERMQCWQPWQPTEALRTAHTSKVAQTDLQSSAELYPSWLLESPQALELVQGQPQFQGPLALLPGPQRLEAGWLEGTPTMRDYFIAQSQHTGLLWVYRERLDRQQPRWYLHGYFA